MVVTFKTFPVVFYDWFFLSVEAEHYFTGELVLLVLLKHLLHLLR